MFNQSKKDELKDKVVDGVETAKDKVVDGVETAKDKAADLVDDAKDVANDAADQAKKAVNVSADEVKAMIAQLQSLISDKADDLADHDAKDLKRALKKHYRKLKNASQETAGNAWKQGHAACSKMVEQKPVTSVLAVAGLAALLGYFFAKKSDHY